MKWTHLLDAMKLQIEAWLEDGTSPETIEEIFLICVQQMIDEKVPSTTKGG